MENTCDRTRGRLSAYLDDELAAAERAALEAHLGACAACRRLADDLRALVARAAALPASGPPRDLWPEVRRAMTQETRAAWRPPGWLVGFAAGAALSLALLARSASRSSLELARVEPGYLLLLHEPPEDLAATRAEVEASVARYRAWAEDLAARDVLLAGEKLVDEGGWLLRPGSDGVAVEERREIGGIGGYFVLRAGDADAALALSETCPHLAEGGWIELRPIECLTSKEGRTR